VGGESKITGLYVIPPTIFLTLEKISRVEKFLPPQGWKKSTIKAFYEKLN